LTTSLSPQQSAQLNQLTVQLLQASLALIQLQAQQLFHDVVVEAPRQAANGMVNPVGAFQTVSNPTISGPQRFGAGLGLVLGSTLSAFDDGANTERYRCAGHQGDIGRERPDIEQIQAIVK
jgi:hypothetical protein